MMKSFKPQPWLLPQPVLIIGTYDEQGRPNAMNAAWGGQWDMKEIMVSMGKHATTENLNRQGDFTVAFATQATMTASSAQRTTRKRWKRRDGRPYGRKTSTLRSSPTSR